MPDGAYSALAAITAMVVVRWMLAREGRRRKERAAGAPPNQWERSARLGRLSMTPSAWIIFWLVVLVLLSSAVSVVTQLLR